MGPNQLSGELALASPGGAEGIPGTVKKGRNLCWDASRKLGKNCFIQFRLVSWHHTDKLCILLTYIKLKEHFNGYFLLLTCEFSELAT